MGLADKSVAERQADIDDTYWEDVASGIADANPTAGDPSFGKEAVRALGVENVLQLALSYPGIDPWSKDFRVASLAIACDLPASVIPEVIKRNTAEIDQLREGPHAFQEVYNLAMYLIERTAHEAEKNGISGKERFDCVDKSISYLWPLVRHIVDPEIGNANFETALKKHIVEGHMGAWTPVDTLMKHFGWKWNSITQQFVQVSELK